MPEKLTITVDTFEFGDYFKPGTYKTYNGKLYLCSSKDSNDKAEEGKNAGATKSVRVTYSYVGNNGQTVTAQKIFTFTKNTDYTKWKDFK